MNIDLIPPRALKSLMQNAIGRDPVTARRAALVGILAHERAFTRDQLIRRVEPQLGKSCFGESAWEDAFYRDMRAVKTALEAAGHRLVFRRGKHNPGYQLLGEGLISGELFEILAQSIKEIDQRQIAVLRQRTHMERFRLGCSITNTAARAVAYRMRQRQSSARLPKG